MHRPPILPLIAATTLIRVAFAATTGLGVDESYMVTAGRTLSLGYFDHPPAGWWLSWGAAHLLHTEAPIAVRLPFILLFAVSQFLVWRIGCLIASKQAGFWAAVALNIAPVFGVTTGTWVLPDGPLDAALLGAALCLLHALPPTGRRTNAWWAGAGVCAGLALCAKYSAVLTIAGAFLYLLLTPWLRRKQPYLAAALALLVFSPVLIWNATHAWASFAFQGDRALGIRIRPLMPVETLAGEALFVLPWFWLPMMIALINGFRRNAEEPRRLLSWLAAPPIVAFALISAWSSQRILYHWAAPGYLMLFPPFGEAIARNLNRPWVRRGLAASAGLILLAMTSIATQVQFDWLGSIPAAVTRTDPTAEGLDWTWLADDLHARGVLPPGTIAASLNWRDAGKIGHAIGPNTTMLCLCADSRQFGFAHPLRDYAGDDVLVLLVDPAEQTLKQAKAWFRSVDTLPPSSVRLHGRVLHTITILLGHTLSPSAIPVYGSPSGSDERARPAAGSQR
jgi:4-amino-4-deoxy-L-arabinose transferase-like glycosyltransferase